MQLHEQSIPVSKTRLVALVEDILAKPQPGEKLHRQAAATDANLIDIGLTSVDMVNLMLAVEAEFDVMIPPSEITPENFRSIATIEALISRLDG